MNSYLFERINETAIRAIWFEEVEGGFKSVVDIMEMNHSPTKESLKHTVRCLYEMMFIGDQPSDVTEGYSVSVTHKDYDASLEGKARKKSSKEINVITEQLFV